MGKGDAKTKRGKIWRGTYGARRPKTRNSDNNGPDASKE